METGFEKIRNELDWVHDEHGYCVKYIVRHWKEEWSRGEYYMVDGVLANGGVVDLGSFPTYQYDTKWLAGFIGEHEKKLQITYTEAREYWKNLSDKDLLGFWKVQKEHATIPGVTKDTPFDEYVILSALDAQFCIDHDC